MNLKRLLCVLMAAAMTLSLAACSKDEPQEADDQNPGVQDGADKTDDKKGEENKEDDKQDDAPADVSTMTKEQLLEAAKNEPAWGQPVVYWYDGGNCTSAPYLAEKQGYFEEYGIEVELLNGTAIKEALGTNSAQIGVSHIASLLVPITNKVDYTFVAGAHIGCKSLYVLNDSDYQTTEDLKGTNISVPNGIGNSDYNITAILLDADGIDPLNDVNLTPVETSACIAAMQNGELSAALLSDTYAYKMVQDGTLRCIRSLVDDDFQNVPCCVLAMSNQFRNENPAMARLVVDCVKRGGDWGRENPEEAVQLLLDDEKISGDFDMNVELWNQLKMGLTDDFTETGLRKIVEDYLRLGLIVSMDDADEIMDMAWNPQGYID